VTELLVEHPKLASFAELFEYWYDELVELVSFHIPEGTSEELVHEFDNHCEVVKRHLEDIQEEIETLLQFILEED
jgi:hypothetical protein